MSDLTGDQPPPMSSEEPKDEPTCSDEPKDETTCTVEPKNEPICSDEPKNEPTCSSKPKKCRRGKKKKHRNRHGHQQNPDSLDSDGFRVPLPPTDAEKKACSTHHNRKRNRKILIRPVDVPKAPENSTQFIIDDHDESNLYFNFEKPNPFNSSAENKSDNYEEDAAFQDIDYKYESLQDLDNSAYYIQDFETNYSNMRYEELSLLPRQEILDRIESTESRLLELEEKLYEQDPKLALERLQQKLLQLQEENLLLNERNTMLKKTLETKDNCVAASSGTSLDESGPFDDDIGSHSCEECNSSSDSSQDSENEGALYVPDDGYPSEDANAYLPEYNDLLHINHDHVPNVRVDYSTGNSNEYMNDIYALQNNYRAHRISEGDDSYYADDSYEEADASGEGHDSSEHDAMEDDANPADDSNEVMDVNQTDFSKDGFPEGIAEAICQQEADSNPVSCDGDEVHSEGFISGHIASEAAENRETQHDVCMDDSIVSSSGIPIEESSNESAQSDDKDHIIESKESEANLSDNLPENRPDSSVTLLETRPDSSDNLLEDRPDSSDGLLNSS